MNWLARRKTLKIAAVFFLFLTAGITYVAWQPDGLTRYKAHLAARGEVLSLSKLATPYSEEAAEHHQRLGDAVARLVFTPIAPGAINVMAKATNGRAPLAWTQPTPAGPARGTWEDFAVQMDASEPALAELRSLLATPVDGSSYKTTAPFTSKPKFDLISRRKAAQTLAAAVVNDLHRSRLDAALTNLQALINLARYCDDGDLLVGRMIQVAIAGLGVAATWESLPAPGWTEAQLASLQSAWQSLSIADGFARTVEMERAHAVSFYEIIRTNATERGNMFGSTGTGKKKFTETLYENVYLPIWAKTWSQGDELEFLKIMQPVVEGVRNATTNGNYHALRATFAETMRDIRSRQTILNRFRYPLASMVVPNWEKAATRLLRCETQRQMAITAIALKRHQLLYGRLPDDLAPLTPGLLPAPPIDYMNGRQLLYRRVSDGRFTLRSVGNDGRNDQGAGDDLIWPEPEQAPSADARP